MAHDKDKDKNTSSLRGTKSSYALTSPHTDNGILTVRYEEALPARPPIPVTVAPPRAPPTDTHPALRRPKGAAETDMSKRDSGLAATTSSKAREGSVRTVDTIDENALGLKIDFDSIMPSANPPQTPVASTPKPVRLDSMGSTSTSTSRWRRPGSRKSSTSRKAPKTPTSPAPEDFEPISTPIPTDSLMDEEFLKSLSFSKRGSVMLGGKKAVNSYARMNGGRRQPSLSMLASPSVKVLSEEAEAESQKVRSMYEQGAGLDWQDGRNFATAKAVNVEHPITEEEPMMSNGQLGLNGHTSHERPETALSVKQEHELAGGIEDWEDISGPEVDRYGFINKEGSLSRPGTPEARLGRVSTVLQMASDTPRKKRTFGRAYSASSQNGNGQRAPSRKVSARSLNTVNSGSSQRSTGRMRAAANRLPGNRDRRWMDEAGDMLTLPPGLADIAEDADGGKVEENMKKKEWERAEKWRKMAKVLKQGTDGEGMAFEFDARSPKLIARTWKGIPDRWRAAAWYSFLSTSAKKRKDSPTEESITQAFYRLLYTSSADDVQIDIDVPRTINHHIMFRKRYRGGQRLLFRVLHALALYFPDTGYVQGMASLAATLLCYFDEERAFVMLVRMWTLRGLDKLYEPGFPGLMSALDEFHKNWLDGGEVAKKLEELCIEPTAYGTRWYLTLFNYSIPFPAQLRVWDVFMLLGDSDTAISPTPERPFAGGLDILHATSAALIDGTREILLDSDFENAMKVLTSWIPIKDQELLMRVTKAEWKLHRRKRV